MLTASASSGNMKSLTIFVLALSLMPSYAPPGQPDNTPPVSAHKWTIVTRSPGTNQPPIHLPDKFNPLWWFGNVDEPVAPDWYLPGKAHRNFRYHLRNPCHNFFCYVVGMSDKTFRRAGKYPNDNFSPHGGWNVAASNYKCPCLWLPFISYEHRGFQFYTGWRNGGNFGIKLRYSKPKPVAASRKSAADQIPQVG